MSYDVIVFDAKVAPKSEEEFEDWLDEVDEADDFTQNPSKCSANLQSFFTEFSVTFPAMGTSENDLENLRETPYGFSKHTIEANFAFSVAQEAGKLMLKIGPKHDVGIYDEQDGEVYFPISQSEYQEGFI